jgi:hypothetical protein
LSSHDRGAPSPVSGDQYSSKVQQRHCHPAVFSELRAHSSRFNAVTNNLVGGITNQNPPAARGRATRRAVQPVVLLLRPAPAEAERADRPAAPSNTYDGQRLAIFYTKVHNRLLRPLLAADTPPAALEVRQALKVLDHAATDYINQARIAA